MDRVYCGALLELGSKTTDSGSRIRNVWFWVNFDPLLTGPKTASGSEVLVSYSDKVLTCRECSREFIFTAGEQEFYASRGLVNEPGRCPECRANRRARTGVAGDGATANGDRSSRPQREMHPAVCANCGAQTMVPFLPRNDKPVYCSSCFERVRAAR